MEELVKELRLACEDERYGGKHLYLSLINRSADAIEQLDKDIERAKEYEAFWEKEANEALRKFQVAIANKPHWIPVTERLPNENDDVLIYGEWTGASGTKYREIWLTDLKGFLHQGYKPIAWMPLQEPPREEQADPCSDCRHYPPSSTDGKPCCACDPSNPLTNCHDAKEET